MNQSIFGRWERTAYRRGRLILVIAPSRNPNPSPPAPDNACNGRKARPPEPNWPKRPAYKGGTPR
jgi:hypothetical protein